VTAAPRAGRAIAEAIQVIPNEWFHPKPGIYWVDLMASASLGWTTFVLAVASGGWRRTALLVIAAVALYRAVLFIHEITHLAARDVPAFRVVWNALVGVPLLIPSFLYENVHTDHHRQRCYGTDADPEYLPFGRRPPLLMAGWILASLAAPAAFALRFGVLAPLSWLVPAWRRAVTDHASALVINRRYVRRAPIDVAGCVQEAAAFVVVWSAAALWWSGWIPTAAFGCWIAVSASASAVNALRTLAAHRYDHDSGEVSMTDQLLDSCTLAPATHWVWQAVRWTADISRALIAPVGLRYHALHHWIPSLPYHNLGRAHRLLLATLRPDAPYRATLEHGLAPAIRDLIRRARTQAH
jgi:fatty acid desaturase